MFGGHEMLVEPVLVYERGDTLADVLERVEAITPDPAAGRAARDPVHSTIEGVAEDMARPSRIMLSELIAAGLLAVEVLDLPDAAETDISDPTYRRNVRMRWNTASSPLERAAWSAGHYLEASNVDIGTIALMPKGMLGATGSTWVLECRETHLQELVIYLGHNRITDALFILRPERKRPLRALRIAAPDPAALPTDDLAGWVSERAPHIRRIG
jgi:hypothetical protein